MRFRFHPLLLSALLMGALGVVAIGIVGCAEEGGPKDSASSNASDASEPLRLSLAAWRVDPLPLTHWIEEDGTLAALQTENGIAIEVMPEGGAKKTVLAAFAHAGARSDNSAPLAWAGFTEVLRGTHWKVQIPADHPCWQGVAGRRPLRVEIAAFEPAAYARLEELGPLAAEERQRLWRELRASALLTQTATIYVAAEPPQIELAATVLDGTRLERGADGLVPALPLRVRAPFLQAIQIEDRVVPAEEWSAISERGADVDASDRVILVPWPEKDGQWLSSVRGAVLDRLGREQGFTIEYQSVAEGHRAPYLRTDVTLGSGGRLENWLHPSDRTRWTFEGQDEQGRPRLHHRCVAAGSEYMLSLRAAPGEARVAELVFAPEVMPMLGAQSTSRMFVAIPKSGGLVHFDVPLPALNQDETRCRAMTWCELRVWPRAVLPDGVVPDLAGPRQALATSAKVERYFVEIYRDEEPPLIDTALSQDGRVAFAADGDPLLEFATISRFPHQVTVADRELPGPFDDSEWIDSGSAYIGKLRTSLLGRRVRGFAVPWPRDASGALRTTFPLRMEDRLGRKAERIFACQVDAALPPLPVLEELQEPEVAAAPKPARLVIESSCVGQRSIPRFEWNVKRSADVGEVVLRRRVSIFPMETVRLRVDAPPGDYRVELMVLRGAIERLEGLSHGVVRAAGGETVQFAFDLRSMGARSTNFTTYWARIALFRAEDRPDTAMHRSGEMGAPLDFVNIDVTRDSAAPAFLFESLPESPVNPIPDPAQRRPPSVFALALMERYPLDLLFDGIRVPLADPLAMDAGDQSGELFAREERNYVWPWPEREDGEHEFLLGIRDRTQRWYATTFKTRYDRTPPQVQEMKRATSDAEQGGLTRVSVVATEALRDCVWTSDQPPVTTVRFVVEGNRASADFAPSALKRLGTLRATDRAGNALELKFSPDGD